MVRHLVQVFLLLLSNTVWYMCLMIEMKWTSCIYGCLAINIGL